MDSDSGRGEARPSLRGGKSRSRGHGSLAGTRVNAKYAAASSASRKQNLTMTWVCMCTRAYYANDVTDIDRQSR